MPPVRRRPSAATREAKTLSIVYYMNRNTTKIPVCRETFLSVLGITKHRVQGVAKRFQKSGVMPKENRGGDRRTQIYS